MKKPLFIILICLLIAGVVVAYFSDIEIVDYISLAVAFVSAGAICATTVAKSSKKDWKVYTAVPTIALSCFLLGFCGVAADTVTKIITGVAGVLVLIVGIITAAMASKIPKVIDNTGPK